MAIYSVTAVASCISRAKDKADSNLTDEQIVDVILHDFPNMSNSDAWDIFYHIERLRALAKS